MDWLKSLNENDIEKAKELMQERAGILESELLGKVSREKARERISSINNEIAQLYKRRKRWNQKIYACYRGDDYMFDGTLVEIAARLHWKIETARWMTTPTAQRRMTGYRRNGKPKNCLMLIEI